MNKKYTVTSALPYANGPLHIGHIAGVYLPADIYVRYRKSKGDDILFVCGSDEHGAAITLRAKQDGVSPKDIVDRYHAINKKAFADFGIDFDVYHRTSSDLHNETAANYFKNLEDQGCFTKKTSEQKKRITRCRWNIEERIFTSGYLNTKRNNNTLIGKV